IHPYTRDTYHARLAPEFALSAYLVGYACYFEGERIELIHHRVDGVLQVENFALHFDGDLPGEIAIGDRDGKRVVMANLGRYIGGHEIDVVGQVLPGAGNAFHAGLAPELTFSSHFTRHARYFEGERIELIHHRVDGVLQVENFAPHFDGDLPGEIATGDSAAHIGNIADLHR